MMNYVICTGHVVLLEATYTAEHVVGMREAWSAYEILMGKSLAKSPLANVKKMVTNVKMPRK
jgi:hypothetical protein